MNSLGHWEPQGRTPELTDSNGGCQNYGPFSDPCYNTAPNIKGTQKGIIILTTTLIASNPKLFSTLGGWG